MTDTFTNIIDRKDAIRNNILDPDLEKAVPIGTRNAHGKIKTAEGWVYEKRGRGTPQAPTPGTGASSGRTAQQALAQANAAVGPTHELPTTARTISASNHRELKEKLKTKYGLTYDKDFNSFTAQNGRKFEARKTTRPGSSTHKYRLQALGQVRGGQHSDQRSRREATRASRTARGEDRKTRESTSSGYEKKKPYSVGKGQIIKFRGEDMLVTRDGRNASGDRTKFDVIRLSDNTNRKLLVRNSEEYEVRSQTPAEKRRKETATETARSNTSPKIQEATDKILSHPSIRNLSAVHVMYSESSNSVVITTSRGRDLLTLPNMGYGDMMELKNKVHEAGYSVRYGHHRPRGSVY